MFRLIATELRRFLHRRMFLFGLIGVFAIVGMTGIGAYNASSPPSEAELVQAQEWSDQNNRENADYYGPGGRCESEYAAAGMPTEDCLADYEPSTAADFLWQQSYGDFAPGNQTLLAAILIFFALAAGASFITAEISSGALGNWLTFEPRRLRVYASKSIALVIAMSVISIVFHAVVHGMFRSIAVVNKALGDKPELVDKQLFEAGLRIVALAAMVTLIGMALGTITKNATLALGSVILVSIVDPIVMSTVAGAWRFTVTPRITAWLTGEYIHYDYAACESEWALGKDCMVPEIVLHQAPAGWYLLALTAVAVILGATVMRRRDVA